MFIISYIACIFVYYKILTYPDQPVWVRILLSVVWPISIVLMLVVLMVPNK